MSTTETIASLNATIILAHRALGAKKADFAAATGLAAALTAAGATDNDIDAAERDATLASRACVRIDREIDALVVQRADAVARERAENAKRLNTLAASELTAICKDHRALLAKIAAHARTRYDFAELGLNAEAASLPSLCYFLYDQGQMQGPRGTITAQHPALDFLENELARFKRAIKSGVAE